MKKIIRRFLSKILLAKKDNKPKFSYSQSGEDLIIQYICGQLGIKNPSYLDIGAHHPFLFSNTARFYLQGSRGVNIEADPDLFGNFIIHRTQDINLNIGIGPKSKTIPFYVMSPPTLNTFSFLEVKKIQSENKNIKLKSITKIKVVTVNSILKKYFSKKTLDILFIDVEGFEDKILKSLNFKLYKPTIICVETISYSETGHGIKNWGLIKFLINQGYLQYADTYINTIFVQKNIWEK